MKKHIINLILLFILNVFFQSILSYFIDDKIEYNSILVQSIFFAIVMTVLFEWIRKREAKEKLEGGD